MTKFGLFFFVVCSAVIYFLGGTVHAARIPRLALPTRHRKTSGDTTTTTSNNDSYSHFNPFPDEQDDRSILRQKLTSGLAASATTLYGIALLVYGRHFPRQIHIITLMRATGFDKLESIVRETRNNYRSAYRSAIFRAPSLLQAHHTIVNIDDRIRAARHVMQVTKEARADGKITPAEERKIRKLRKREIRLLHRDMKRMRRASLTVWKLIQLLDFDEILDIIQSFFFQISAILASGNSNSVVGSIISHWCYFLTLASLACDVSKKCGYPLVRFLIEFHLRETKLDKSQLDVVRNINTAVIYSVAAFVIMSEFGFACKLTAGLLVALIIVRGLRGLLYCFSASDDGHEAVHHMETTAAGYLAILFTATSLYVRRCDLFGEPNGAFRQLLGIEEIIQDFSTALEKLS